MDAAQHYPYYPDRMHGWASSSLSNIQSEITVDTEGLFSTVKKMRIFI